MTNGDGAGLGEIVAILKEMTAGVRIGLEIIQTFSIKPGESEPEPASCLHPEEARVDFSTMTERAWTCRACGYNFKQPRASSPTQ